MSLHWQIVRAFESRFGGSPAFVVRAPGRVNLIGEHTDYNDGLVMPVALAQRCAAAAAPRDDGLLRLVAADLAPPRNVFEHDLGATPPDLRGRWQAYTLGPAAMCAALAGRRVGADVAIASDVPIGAGLSSSAAAEVAVASAVSSLWGVALPPLDLARLCQRAEHEFAGVPCGLMDQMASVFGREGCAMLIDCRDNRVEHVPLPPAGAAALVVADSGVRHSLAAGQYAARRAACAAAARALGLASLRDADEATINAAGLPRERRDCALHVVRENERVRAFAAAVRAGDLPAAGARMNESHESLRDLYRVSCAELDALVRAAQSVPGVFGSRMTGGGFGGCTVTLCAPRAVAPLLAALDGALRAAHGAPRRAFVVAPSRGAHVLERA